MRVRAVSCDQVTLSECLLDIVTDIVAEEGDVGLHTLRSDPVVDCELLSQLMECHGVDQADDAAGKQQ